MDNQEKYICLISGKHKIRSKRLAEQKMNSINKEKGFDLIKNIYKCFHCSDWHLTKMERKEYIDTSYKQRVSRKPTGNINIDIENRLEFLTKKKK